MLNYLSSFRDEFEKIAKSRWLKALRTGEITPVQLAARAKPGPEATKTWLTRRTDTGGVSRFHSKREELERRIKAFRKAKSERPKEYGARHWQKGYNLSQATGPVPARDIMSGK